MHDALFTLLFLLFPLIALLLFKWLKLSLFQISIPSMVIVFMFAFAYVGLLPLYFGWDRTTGTYEEKLLITLVFFGSSWAIWGILSGFAFSRSILGLKINTFSAEITPLNKGDMLGLKILLLLSLTVLFVYISKVSRIALFVALREGISEAKVARSAMGNAFEGKFHWYSLFFNEIFSFVTFAFWSNWLIIKRKSSFFLFLLSFSFTSFAALMATEKAPFAWLIIGLFLAFLITRRAGRVPVKSIVFLFSLILVIVPIMYMLFMGSRDWKSGTISLFSRAFAGSIAPAQFYLEVFPAQKDFLLGQTFPNPGGILPFTPYRYTVELMNMRFPYLKDIGVVGSMPTVFWGEAYINFGWFGVLVIPVILGAWIWTVTYMLGRMKNSPIKTAGTVLLIFHFKSISITGFSKFFIDISLISLVIILFVSIRSGHIFATTLRKLKGKIETLT